MSRAGDGAEVPTPRTRLLLGFWEKARIESPVKVEWGPCHTLKIQYIYKLLFKWNF
jgi:hypothetical protein